MDISINGTDITPYIAKNGIAWERIDKAEAIETMDGTTHRGRKAFKISLTIGCIEMKSEDLRTIQSLINHGNVTVTYDDPVLGERYVTMYCEKGIANLMVHQRDGTDYWSGVSFTLIEM